MKKGIKKILSYVLALAMVVAMIPATSFADQSAVFTIRVDGEISPQSTPALYDAAKTAWWGAAELEDVTLGTAALTVKVKKDDGADTDITQILPNYPLNQTGTYIFTAYDSTNEVGTCTVKIDTAINDYANAVTAITGTIFADLVDAYEAALANLNLDVDQKASIASNLEAEGMVKVAEDVFKNTLKASISQQTKDDIVNSINSTGTTITIADIERLVQLSRYLDKAEESLDATAKNKLAELVTDAEKAQDVIDLFAPMDDQAYVQDYEKLETALKAYEDSTVKQKTLVDNSNLTTNVATHQGNKTAVDNVITAVNDAATTPYVPGLVDTGTNISTIIKIDVANTAVITHLTTQVQKDLFASTPESDILDYLTTLAAAARPVQAAIDAALATTPPLPTIAQILAAKQGYNQLASDAKALVDATGLDAKVTTAIEDAVNDFETTYSTVTDIDKAAAALKAVLTLKYADEKTVDTIDAAYKLVVALVTDARTSFNAYDGGSANTYILEMEEASKIVKAYKAVNLKEKNYSTLETNLNAFKTAYATVLTEQDAKDFVETATEGKAATLSANWTEAEPLNTTINGIKESYDKTATTAAADRAAIEAAWNSYVTYSNRYEDDLVNPSMVQKLEKSYKSLLSGLGYINTATADGVTVTVMQGMTDRLDVSQTTTGLSNITKVELKVKKSDNGEPTSGTTGIYGTNITVSIEATGTNIANATETKTVNILAGQNLLLKMTTPSKLQKNANLKVYSVDSNKAATPVPNVTFDSNYAAMQFPVTALGDFAIYGEKVVNNPSGGGGSSSSSKKTTDTTNTVTPPTTLSQFTDISGHWAYEAIKYAVENNLFNGTSTTKFSPDTAMTRAMLVTVLYRYEKQPAAGSNTFTDVAAGTWYSDAVAWASNNGIVQGVGNNKFSPDTNLTREQIAVIFYNYAKFKGIDVSATKDISSFSDASKVASWAQTEMKWASAVGLIQGRPENTIDPQASATRAEVATILQRFIQNVVTNTSKTTTDTTTTNTTNSTDKTTDTSTDDKTTK